MTESPSSPVLEAKEVSPASGPRQNATRRYGDSLFGALLTGSAVCTLALVALIAVELTHSSLLSLRAFGFHFLVGTTWDPVAGVFGAWPFLAGTLLSSAVALAIAGPIGVGAALCLSELLRARSSAPLRFLVELLAAVPSVVYGLWGIFVVIPLLQDYVEPFLVEHLGFIPFFNGAPYGVGILAAGVVLSVMVLPTICSVSIDVLRAVPRDLREAGYALGATRWEVLVKTVLPAAKAGIGGAFILALGRALGETMAVTMVIGNRPEIPHTLLDPAHSMSSVLANEFAEASGDLYLSALAEIGLVLFVTTFVVNALARLLLPKAHGAGAHG
ncbi:MAG TPA: phosphate ABC transporter permease subunit PstC [bacterium]|nr:phosphate ABC transporter permease subunit PstC [bacterium]